MDLGMYSPEEYDDCLLKLDRVGALLGGDLASWKALDGERPKSILDVGCGGGYFTYKMACRYPDAEVVGIDLSEEAIRHAKKRHQRPNLSFHHRSTFSDLNPDIVIATLVAHHMTDDELILFLKQAVKAAKKRVVINDLQRSYLAYILFSLTAPWLFRNRLITQDGLLSIRRSFKKEDWLRLLKEAGISPNQWILTWRIPFRWILKINTAL